MYGPWKWFEYDIDKDRNGPVPPTRNNHLLIVSIATKDMHSTHDMQPLQYQYRCGAKETPAVSSLRACLTDALGLSLYRSRAYLRPMEGFR